MSNNLDQLLTLIVIGGVIALLYYRPRWSGSTSACGTAAWATVQQLQAAGMLGPSGLIIGRTRDGRRVIRLRDYCHILLVGGAGTGKGIGFIIPTLLSHFVSSILCHDTKGDLFKATAGFRRRRGQRIIRLAPFNGGADCLNPLQFIPSDSPMLVDLARALADALVVRTGAENDPHWNDKAVQIITAVLVFVLLLMRPELRNLNTVQEIISDPELLRGASNKLIELGGIPGRLGNQIKALFSVEEGGLSREGNGVISTAQRHLAFLDSTLVAANVSQSTFDPAELCKPGTTVYFQVPPEMLGAMKGLVRCWISTFVRAIQNNGDESKSQVLALIDEASAVVDGLGAVEEGLVRGRSAGVRFWLAYQSMSQVEAAFDKKPTLIEDNSSVRIFLGASSYETAEKISKMAGETTIAVESANEGGTMPNAACEDGHGDRSWGRSWAVQARALLKPEEVLAMDKSLVIAFVQGMSPILARRLSWYSDPLFSRGKWPSSWWWWLLTVGALLILWAMKR